MTVERFKALSEPTRIEILNALRSGEIGASDLLDAIPVAQPSLSRHLKVLVEAGLIAVRRQGRGAYYRLAPFALGELKNVLADWENAGRSQYMQDDALITASDPSPSHSGFEAEVEEDEGPRSPSIEEWLN